MDILARRDFGTGVDTDYVLITMLPFDEMLDTPYQIIKNGPCDCLMTHSQLCFEDLDDDRHFKGKFEEDTIGNDDS